MKTFDRQPPLSRFLEDLKQREVCLITGYDRRQIRAAARRAHIQIAIMRPETQPGFFVECVAWGDKK